MSRRRDWILMPRLLSSTFFSLLSKSTIKWINIVSFCFKGKYSKLSSKCIYIWRLHGGSVSPTLLHFQLVRSWLLMRVRRMSEQNNEWAIRHKVYSYTSSIQCRILIGKVIIYFWKLYLLILLTLPLFYISGEGCVYLLSYSLLCGHRSRDERSVYQSSYLGVVR